MEPPIVSTLHTTLIPHSHPDASRPRTDLWKRYESIMPLNTLVPVLLLTLLIVLHLEGYGVSWPVVFVPLWYRSGVALMLVMANIQDSKGDALFDIFIPLMVEGVILTFQVLMLLFLQDIIPLLTYAFIPGKTSFKHHESDWMLVWLSWLVVFCFVCWIPCYV